MPEEIQPEDETDGQQDDSETFEWDDDTQPEVSEQNAN